jgi:hypothetical protein
MKKQFSYLLAMATVLFGLSGCEQIKNAADIKIDTEFEQTFLLNITTATQPDGSAQFTEAGMIDLTDGDVADYVDKLKDVQVKKVRLDLLNYTGPADAEISGSIDVGGGYALNIPPTNLQSLFGLGTIDLSEQAGTFNYIKDELLEQKELNYTVNGVVSKVPVDMQIRVVYELTITANPL